MDLRKVSMSLPVATRTMLSCRHFGHSTASSTTCVDPSCIKRSRNPLAIAGHARSRLECTLHFSASFYYREISVFLLIAWAITNAEGGPSLGFFEGLPAVAGGFYNVESPVSQPTPCFFKCGRALIVTPESAYFSDAATFF
jgi:hypothetical protein